MKDLIVGEAPESGPSRNRPGRWWRIQWSLRSFLVAVLIAGLLTAWLVQKLVNVRTPSVAVLGSMTAGAIITPDPLRDDEIEWAARRATIGEIKIPGSFVVGRISKKLVETRTDPVRNVPLIGPAVLHHQIYRCKLFGKNKGEAGSYVVYIDKNHFHLTGSMNNSTTFAVAPQDGSMPSANEDSRVK